MDGIAITNEINANGIYPLEHSLEQVDLTTEKQLGGATGKGFMPGQSGNPNGRPKGTFSLKNLIIKRLEENPDQREKIINDLIEKEQGLLLQMIDGKPKQSVDMKSDTVIHIDPDQKALIDKALDGVLGAN